MTVPSIQINSWTPDKLANGLWDNDPSIKNFGKNSLLSQLLWVRDKSITQGGSVFVSAFATDCDNPQVPTVLFSFFMLLFRVFPIRRPPYLPLYLPCVLHSKFQLPSVCVPSVCPSCLSLLLYALLPSLPIASSHPGMNYSPVPLLPQSYCLSFYVFAPGNELLSFPFCSSVIFSLFAMRVFALADVLLPAPCE